MMQYIISIFTAHQHSLA